VHIVIIRTFSAHRSTKSTHSPEDGPMRRKSYPSLSCLLICFAGAFLLIFSPILGVARAGTTGSISGRVTDISSNGLPNVQVIVYSLANTRVKAAATDSSGNYTITGLAPASYKVVFTQVSGYIGVFYSGKHSFADADQVTVTVDTTTPNIGAALEAVPTDPFEPNNDIASAFTITPGTWNNLVNPDSMDSDWFKILISTYVCRHN
jgi:hypothetical protein